MIFRTCHELWNSVGPLYQLLLQHFFPWKKDSIEGLMSSNISSCFTLFSTSANTFKFERTNVSTVWLLHNKWYGWWLEPSALGIVFSIPIFFWTASVINSSTFLHKVAGVVFRFSETFAEIDNCLKVFTNNYVIWSIFVREEQWLKSEFLAVGENDY